MRVDWAPLRAELAIWRANKLSYPLWWRDDDAVSASPALDRLRVLSKGMGIAVHIAVIPKFADQALAQVVADTKGGLIPLVHGWAHENHAPKDEKKAEFGSLDKMRLTDATDGLARLHDLFGRQLVPCFVPPWNRMDSAFAPELAKIGYTLLSTYGPRPAPFAFNGLTQINTHIDPINWRGDRSAVPADELVAKLVQTLMDRRTGHSDITEPLGLLTHHLVHDTAIWEISRAVLSELLDGPTTLFAMTPKDQI